MGHGQWTKAASSGFSSTLSPMKQKMTKEQQLRNTAEGFLAGLVACGFRGPWRNRPMWELAFDSVWRDWTQERYSYSFPDFMYGGPSSRPQPRAMFQQIKRTSPLYGYDSEPLTDLIDNPHEYLATNVKGADPEEWIELARAFLDKMAEKPN